MRVTAYIAATLILGLLVVVAVFTSDKYPESEWTEACMHAEPSTLAANDQALRLIEQAVSQDGGAGIAAAVSIDGKVVWSAAAGIAKGNASLDPQARMRIGSVSKPFTAMLAARLADEGLLDIDAPIGNYIPQLPDDLARITARQLVTHTSGIRQYDFSSLGDSNNRKHYEYLSDAFARHMNEPLTAPPGSEYRYSSIGFNLLGIVIERVTALPYERALDQWIAQPLSLSHTTTDDSTRHTPCRTRFYSLYFGRFRLPTLWRDNSDLYPSGGLLSSAEDLVKFADAALAGDLLSEQSRARIVAGNDVSPFGFGWHVHRYDDDSIEWIGHGGTINGAYASLRHYPDFDMTVAGIANYDFVLTGRRPSFFDAVRVRLPALFSGKDPAVFGE